jgi:hypothetical protein
MCYLFVLLRGVKETRIVLSMKKILLLSLLLAVSCKKNEVTPAPKTASDTWDVSDGDKTQETSAGGVNAKGLYEGRLRDAELKEAFDAKQQEVLACFQEGKKRNRYLEGDIRLSFEVTTEGKAQKLFVSSSTLGDDTVEDCFISLVTSMQLPKPIGGMVLAGYTFGYHPTPKPGGSGEPGTEERIKYLEGAKTSLKTCEAPAAEYQAVVWIQPDGKATSAGYSSESQTDEARDCVITALLAAKYPKSYRKATYLLFASGELP